MSLYIRVNCNFFTNRKTLRLRGKLGYDAYWIPQRIWAYAAENQPDGVFKDYSAEELAACIGYPGDANVMLQALLQASFMDAEPLRIHDWKEHNGYHTVFADRAKKAAKARWEKERSKEKGEDQKGEDKRQALLQASTEGKTRPHEFFDRFGNEYPETLRTPAFKAALEQWHQYKSERRESYKPTGAKSCLTRLAAMGAQRAIESLTVAMSNGWRGFFEPKPAQAANKPAPIPHFTTGEAKL